MKFFIPNVVPSGEKSPTGLAGYRSMGRKTTWRIEVRILTHFSRLRLRLVSVHLYKVPVT